MILYIQFILSCLGVSVAVSYLWYVYWRSLDFSPGSIRDS